MSRPLDQPLVDRLSDSEARTPGITNRGEPAHQGLSRFDDHGRMGVIQRIRLPVVAMDRGHHRVPVRVDQARHERPPAAVNDLDLDLLCF